MIFLPHKFVLSYPGPALTILFFSVQYPSSWDFCLPPPSLACIHSVFFILCDASSGCGQILLIWNQGILCKGSGRGVFQYVCFWNNMVVLGSVIIIHLLYRLFGVHIFKGLVVNRWLLGLNVQKHLTSPSSCWEQLWSLGVTPAALCRKIMGTFCCCLEYGVCKPWQCNICLVMFGEVVDLT